eukprot:s1229_g5.t1
MMTGNTVMAGAALALAQWGKLAFFATLLLHYVSGVVLFRFLDAQLGPRRVAATAPLILLIHCAFDALSCRYDSSWPLLPLALGCGVVNAFSSSSSGVVTNMLTGHWHILASSMADVMSGSTLDQSKRSVARRSLGVVCAFVLGVLSAQLLLRCGLPVRFWWLGVAYACLFLLHDAPQAWPSSDVTQDGDEQLPAGRISTRSQSLRHKLRQCHFRIKFRSTRISAAGEVQDRCVEGVLLAELNLPAEVSETLSSLQLYALLLEERLNCIHWEAEARRSAAVVESLLQGVEVLAKPSEEWRESNIQSAAEVPKEVLRGGIELPVASVWEADDRLGSFVKVGGAEGRNSPSALTTEAFRLSSEDAARVICAEGSWDGSESKPTSSREICVVLHGIGKPTMLAVEPLRLDHFDIVAAESLCASSLRAALQAQSMLSELTKRKHSAEQMQSLVSELSMAASTTDLVHTIEKAVQAVTQSSRCMVFFIDDDEAWAPPTATVPEPARLDFDVGLPGKIAMLAKDSAHHSVLLVPAERSEPLGALIYNDPTTCPYWDDVEFGVDQKASVMVAPIMSAGKDLKPLGLIVASAKTSRSKEGDLLSKLWGPISVDFTQQDAEFLEWLASADQQAWKASSHLDRLSLDVMWTRDESEDLLVSEYYTEEAMATRSRARTDGSTGRAGSKASGHGRSVGRVNTVHKFTGHVATALDFTSSKGMLQLVQEAENTCIRDLVAEPHVDVSQWEIDYWVLTSHEQFVLLVTAIRQLDIFDHLSIDDGVLMRFFQAVKNTYRSVPFHNFHHAMSTTHYASKMAKAPVVADLSAYLTYPELFALVIGALCHDLDHRGYNNAFEIMTRSELALRYNDSSPLENHHCARAFETALNGVDCNIFEDLGPEVYNLVRKRMVAGILATDMKHHGEHVGILKEFEVGEPSDSQSQFLVEVLMHAADISNPFMPADKSKRWAVCLNEEFSLQAEKEAELGLPVTSFMSGLHEPQVAAKSLLGFIDFVVTPFTSSVFRLFPDLAELKKFLDQNREAAAIIVEEATSAKGSDRRPAKKSWQSALTRLRGTKDSTGSTNVAELTGQVFQSLANGKDTIGLREFKSTAKFLAQLSEDFSADPEEAFSRIDENQDYRIDRAEFEQEINQIRGLLGTRKLAAALGQVQQDLQIRQSFAEEPEAQAENVPPEVGTLEARTQVLEQMVGYFSTLREDYSQKLEDLKQQQAAMQAREDVGKAKAPPRARVFAGRSKKVAENTKSLNASLGASARLEIKRQYTHQDDFDGPESHAQGREPADDEAADDEEREDEEGENQELDEEDASNDEEEEENEDDMEEEEDDEEDDEDAEEDEADEGQEDEATQLIAAMSAGETPLKTDLETTLPPGSIPEESQGPETTQPPAVPAEPSSKEPEAAAEATAAEAATAEAATAEVATAEAAAVAAPDSSEAPAPSQPSGGTKKGKASKKKPKAKPKKEPKKAQPAPAPSKVDSQRPSLSGATIVAEPSSTKSQSTPAKLGKKSTDEEGFRCVQTLEMGLAVRNAICIGTEVWTVDWAGNVTVRERDDATKVRSEILTNRFVWSMLHMEPHLMWMGQEAMGISLFDTKRKEFKGSLMGGHTGGVTCLASGDALDSSEMKEGHIPRRRAWSGSNDFTIRQWTIETWHSKDQGPQVKDAFVLELGKFKVAISKGLQMHGHKNGVRCMIRIGPTLWSGSDDGTIRLWCTATGACNEVVEKAHTGSVLKLSVVRSFIWSSGIDGFIREWTIGGTERQCVRQIAPEGFAKGAYAIVPLGHEVWTCGHHPNIQVFSQSDFFKTAEHPAHDPYVSNLLTVDRIETKIVWSTSIGDKKLKVWRHTIRGEVPSIDELKAANRLFEEEEEVRAQRMDEFVKRASKLEDELAVSAEEYRAQLEALATDLAKSKAQEEELEARCKHLEEELDGIRQLFEEMGLGKLMDDPEALARFLQRARSLEKIFKDLGLELFLDNPEALRQVLEAFADLGLEHLLKNPEELKNFLQSAKQLKEMLEAAGFGDVFGDPSKLEELKQSLDLLRRVRDLFEKYGLGDAFKDPALLEEILSRYEGLRKAFEEYGFSELFEDPYNLKGFLRNYAKLRQAFKDLGLEYLLDSAAAMRDFLAGHTSGEKELLDLRAKASRLDEAEEKLRRREEELARAREEAKQMRDRLAAFEAIGDLESMKRWKSEASELRALMRAKGNVDSELAELRAMLEEKERERQEVRNLLSRCIVVYRGVLSQDVFREEI